MGTARASCGGMKSIHAATIVLLAFGCSASPGPGDAGATAALCIANRLCQAGGPSGPSGFNGPDSCWDGCNWCHCTAEGTLSECTALACDAGLSPDGGTDAGPMADAGIDCSSVGCGAAPICGQACDAPCGCCPCTDGEEMGTGYVCEGGCFAPRGSGASGDPCTTTSACGAGLSCCYPCGTPGCSNRCEPTCNVGDPGCVGGCLQRP